MHTNATQPTNVTDSRRQCQEGTISTPHWPTHFQPLMPYPILLSNSMEQSSNSFAGVGGCNAPLQHQTSPSHGDMDEIYDEYAIQYLNHVKKRFQYHPDVYSEFIDLLQMYGRREMDTQSVVRRVYSLFHFDETLIAGFNVFLPEYYHYRAQDIERNYPAGIGSFTADEASPISFSDSEDSSSETSSGRRRSFNAYDSATRYLETVKDRFGETSDTYKCFLYALREYKMEGSSNMGRVLEQVSALFAGHPDLLEEFIPYFPESFQERARAQFDLALNKKKCPESESGSDSEFGACVVCMDRQRSHSFVPCGHLCVCGYCASRSLIRYGSCPVCCQRASQTMRICLP